MSFSHFRDLLQNAAARGDSEYEDEPRRAHPDRSQSVFNEADERTTALVVALTGWEETTDPDRRQARARYLRAQESVRTAERSADVNEGLLKIP